MGRGHVDVLPKGGRPAGRIAPGEARENAAVCEVIEHRNVLGQLHRIDDREIHTELSDTHLLGVLCHEIVPHQGIGGRLDAFHLQVLFGHAEPSVAKGFRELHLLAQAIHQYAKTPLVGARELNALTAADEIRNDQDRELHRRLQFLDGLPGAPWLNTPNLYTLSTLPSVLLVTHLLHPIDRLAVEALLYRDMRHRCRRRCPVPVFLAGRKGDDVAGANFLDWATLPLDPPAARRDNQGLTERMCMPGGAGTWFKGDARAANAPRIGRGEERVYPHRSSEVVLRSLARGL